MATKKETTRPGRKVNVGSGVETAPTKRKPVKAKKPRQTAKRKKVAKFKEQGTSQAAQDESAKSKAEAKAKANAEAKPRQERIKKRVEANRANQPKVNTPRKITIDKSGKASTRVPKKSAVRMPKLSQKALEKKLPIGPPKPSGPAWAKDIPGRKTGTSAPRAKAPSIGDRVPSTRKPKTNLKGRASSTAKNALNKVKGAGSFMNNPATRFAGKALAPVATAAMFSEGVETADEFITGRTAQDRGGSTMAVYGNVAKDLGTAFKDVFTERTPEETRSAYQENKYEQFMPLGMPRTQGNTAEEDYIAWTQKGETGSGVYYDAQGNMINGEQYKPNLDSVGTHAPVTTADVTETVYDSRKGVGNNYKSPTTKAIPTADVIPTGSPVIAAQGDRAGLPAPKNKSIYGDSIVFTDAANAGRVKSELAAGGDQGFMPNITDLGNNQMRIGAGNINTVRPGIVSDRRGADLSALKSHVVDLTKNTHTNKPNHGNPGIDQAGNPIGDARPNLGGAADTAAHLANVNAYKGNTIPVAASTAPVSANKPVTDTGVPFQQVNTPQANVAPTTIPMTSTPDGSFAPDFAAARAEVARNFNPAPGSTTGTAKSLQMTSGSFDPTAAKTFGPNVSQNSLNEIGASLAAAGDNRIINRAQKQQRQDRLRAMVTDPNAPPMSPFDEALARGFELAGDGGGSLAGSVIRSRQAKDYAANSLAYSDKQRKFAQEDQLNSIKQGTLALGQSELANKQKEFVANENTRNADASYKLSLAKKAEQEAAAYDALVAEVGPAAAAGIATPEQKEMAALRQEALKIAASHKERNQDLEFKDIYAEVMQGIVETYQKRKDGYSYGILEPEVPASDGMPFIPFDSTEAIPAVKGYYKG